MGEERFPKKPKPDVVVCLNCQQRGWYLWGGHWKYCGICKGLGWMLKEAHNG